MTQKLTLRQWRRMKEVGQKELADEVGVTPKTIYNYEHDGFGSASFEVVMKIIEYLDITLDQLDFNEEEK